MSNRELCDAILDSFTDTQLVNVASMLQAMRKTIDDLEDDAFCEALYQQYMNDPDKGETMTEDDLCRELGIAL